MKQYIDSEEYWGDDVNGKIEQESEITISYNKQMLANSLADTVFVGMSQCARYGMTWGCDGNCPVLQVGKCEIQEQNNYLLNT